MARKEERAGDREAFLKVMAPLSSGTFAGTDLVYDEASRTMTLTLTHPEQAGRSLFGRRRHPRIRISVSKIASYKQYLTGRVEEAYVLDRAEVGRGGEELCFYFRPGDRAVMDVSRIDVSVVETGEQAVPHRPPAVVNPLLHQDRTGG